MLSSTSIPAMSRDGWSPQPRMRSWRKTSSTTPSTVTVAPRTPSMLIVAARWCPNRYRNSSSISASCDPTPAPEPQITNPIPNPSAKHCNTSRTSPPEPDGWKTPAHFPTASSWPTTTNPDTPGSGCTLPPRCTSAPPSRSEPNGKSRSTAPTPSTRNASHAGPDPPNHTTALGSPNPSTSHNQPCKHNLSHLT